MTDYIFFGAILLFEFAIFYFLPVFNGRGTLFGLVLSEENYLNEGLPIIKNFRRDLFFILILTAALSFLVIRFYPQSLAFIYIFTTGLILVLMFKYLRKSWKLRDKRIVGRLAASLKPRNLKEFSNFWLETGVILLTVAPFLILWFYYSQLPEKIPVHWNLSGEIDRWERKSFFSVFFAPVLAVWLQVFWLILKQDIVQARLRVPAGEDASKILSLKENSLLANVGLIDWCRLFGGLLLAAVGLLMFSVVNINPALSSGFNFLLWTSLGLLIFGVAFYIYRIILVNREIKILAGQITFQTADEIAGWNAAGLYYYNPKDAAFMIEKPGGVGYTLNLAHKKSLIYLALILSPLAFVFLNLALMTN